MPGKIVSVFEPHAEIIRKGNASKPTEFGKLVQISDAENQIVTRLDLFANRPSYRPAFADQCGQGSGDIIWPHICALLLMESGITDQVSSIADPGE